MGLICLNPLEKLRRRLASADALLPLSLIGIGSGFATGLVIICFRLLTESSIETLVTNGDPEGFETLSWPLRLLLPICGGLVIGVLFQRTATGSREVGVVHVMDRLAYAAGRLPWRNAVLQFIGGALSIVSGHSMGREGPVIHVGAASASLLGQWIRLPNNSLRVLVACGTAASIAASFNTPIAGVIFAMEVVMMEYTLVGFTPVILAAVAATSLSRAVYGAAPAFNVPALQMASLWELPYLLLVGVTVGALAALFIHAIGALDKQLRHIALWLRTTLAGAVTGLCALAAPQVMGIGYDTVEATLNGSIAVQVLLLVVVAKLIATIFCVGLGLPGGLIGPTLVIGAAAGGALGVIGATRVPEYAADAALYAMLGMGAMMGATLQAPLAALMAILELTANPNSILPGMFVIVAATLTSKVLFHKDSVFVMMLRARGKDYRHDPVAVSLSRTGVGAVMSRRISTIDNHNSVTGLNELLSNAPQWVLITEAQRIIALGEPQSLGQTIESHAEDVTMLTDLPGLHLRFATVPPQATLREALDGMKQQEADVALVSHSAFAGTRHAIGVLTREQIESSVRYG